MTIDWLTPGSLPQLGAAFTVLGYVIGILVYFLVERKNPNRTGITSRQRAILLFSAVVAGVLGAKLTQWVYLGWPLLGAASITDFNAGGRTILGGLIIGWIAVEVVKWRLGIKSSTGLPFALALPAGEAVGRIGCWYNGCCGGIETGAILAVDVSGTMRHPTQVYHFLAAVLVLAALLLIKPYLQDKGHLFRYYLVLWGLSRFTIEFFRMQDQLYCGLSLTQWLSLELTAAGGIMICWTALGANKVSTAAISSDKDRTI